jgi:hypothetical protein
MTEEQWARERATLIDVTPDDDEKKRDLAAGAEDQCNCLLNFVTWGGSLSKEFHGMSERGRKWLAFNGGSD